MFLSFHEAANSILSPDVIGFSWVFNVANFSFVEPNISTVAFALTISSLPLLNTFIKKVLGSSGEVELYQNRIQLKLSLRQN